MKKWLLYILLPITFISCGELLLKSNINQLDIKESKHTEVSTAVLSKSIKTIVQNPKVALAICLIITGGILWMVAMSKFELSFLYPFLSIDFLVIVTGSQFILGEEVSLYRYISVMLIMGGLFIISKSPYKDA